MTKTLEELAQTEITLLLDDKGSIFNPSDPSSKALGYLKDTAKYEVAAASGSRVGVVTVRSLLGVEQPQRTKIESIWDQVGAAKPEDTVLTIVEVLLANSVRALPVVSRSSVEGIISQVDILMAMSDVNELKNTPVSTIIQTPVISMEELEGIAQARRKMLDENISHIPITKNGKLKGIVTAQQIVHSFITPASKTTRGDRGGKSVSRFPGQVSGIMDTQPCTVSKQANALDVARSFAASGKSSCLLVDEEHHVLGIVTPKEMLSLIADLRPKPRLPVYIVGITDEGFFEQSVAENKVRRTVSKSLRIHPDLNEVRIMIKKQSVGGERTRYHLTARAIGPSTSFQAKHEGWGLMETFDGLCDALEKTLRRAKKEPQKGPRRGRRRPNPNLKP